MSPTGSVPGRAGGAIYRSLFAYEEATGRGYAFPDNVGFLFRSEEDYGPAAEQRMARKRDDYFAAGTRVVWDVDVLREERVRSYAAERPEEPRVFGRGEVADAEPALPAWSMPVDDLFRGGRRR